MLPRLNPLRHVLAAAASGVVGLSCLGAGAAAQGKLDGRYVVTLAGVPIGKGVWIIDIADDQYTAAASGVTTGLLRVFASGQGSTAARGYVAHGGALVPSSYASTVTADKKTEELRITLASGNVKDFSVDPPATPHPDRVPVTEAHRRGVVDPMTGTLARVTGTGDPVSPEACNRSVSVFDGRLRYDLKAAYKRMDTVRAKGYAGPAVVCAVYFTPIAGYIPDRPIIKWLVAQRDMEAWLVPIAGTRVLVPFRFSLPTPLGQGVLEATQFVTTAQPPRAASMKVH